MKNNIIIKIIILIISIYPISLILDENSLTKKSASIIALIFLIIIALYPFNKKLNAQKK